MLFYSIILLPRYLFINYVYFSVIVSPLKLMSSLDVKCGECNKSLPKHLRIINCDTCKQFFHVKCCGVYEPHKTFKSVKSSNTQWNCKVCEDKSNLIYNKVKSPRKKAKCGNCRKNIHEHLQTINCDTCKKFFHVKCFFFVCFYI